MRLCKTKQAERKDSAASGFIAYAIARCCVRFGGFMVSVLVSYEIIARCSLCAAINRNSDSSPCFDRYDAFKAQLARNRENVDLFVACCPPSLPCLTFGLPSPLLHCLVSCCLCCAVKFRRDSFSASFSRRGMGMSIVSGVPTKN